MRCSCFRSRGYVSVIKRIKRGIFLVFVVLQIWAALPAGWLCFLAGSGRICGVSRLIRPQGSLSDLIGTSLFSVAAALVLYCLSIPPDPLDYSWLLFVSCSICCILFSFSLCNHLLTNYSFIQYRSFTVTRP